MVVVRTSTPNCIAFRYVANALSCVATHEITLTSFIALNSSGSNPFRSNSNLCAVWLPRCVRGTVASPPCIVGAVHRGITRVRFGTDERVYAPLGHAEETTVRRSATWIRCTPAISLSDGMAERFGRDAQPDRCERPASQNSRVIRTHGRGPPPKRIDQRRVAPRCIVRSDRVASSRLDPQSRTAPSSIRAPEACAAAICIR
jgi:hypothetical protein